MNGVKWGQGGAAIVVNAAFSISALHDAIPLASVSFLVTVPDEPPDGTSLLVAGNHRALGGWKPDGLRLR